MLNKILTDEGKKRWRCEWRNSSWAGHSATHALAHMLRMPTMCGKNQNTWGCSEAKGGDKMNELSRVQHHVLHEKTTATKEKNEFMSKQLWTTFTLWLKEVL